MIEPFYRDLKIFYLKKLLIHLFICIYIVWAISPLCPPPSFQAEQRVLWVNESQKHKSFSPGTELNVIGKISLNSAG
jgi:hypothetical protein